MSRLRQSIAQVQAHLKTCEQVYCLPNNKDYEFPQQAIGIKGGICFVPMVWEDRRGGTNEDA